MRTLSSILIVGAMALVLVGTTLATGSYTTADPPAAPTDNGDIEDACQTIMVPSDGVNGDNIVSVSVTATIDHTWVGDVTLLLTGPNCGPQFIMHRPGVVGQGGAGVGDSSDLCSSNPLGFDEANADDAESAGAAGAGGDCIGVVGPDQFFPNDDAGVTNFNACEGTNAVGAWILCMGDYAGGDLGTLQTWTLDLTTDPVELIEFTVD